MLLQAVPTTAQPQLYVCTYVYWTRLPYTYSRYQEKVLRCKLKTEELLQW